MNRIARLCIGAACLVIPVLAGAQEEPIYSTTQELTARTITLPTSDPGIVTVLAECSDCPVSSWMTSTSTVYEVGDRAVDVAELRRLIALHPQALVLIVLNPDQKSVKRVMISAADAAATP